MVALVLDDAGVKSFRLALDRTAVEVEAAVADAREARHDAAQSGHRQTAFPALFLHAPDRLDRRIDEDRLGHRRRVGIAVVAVEAEDDELQVDADLRCREPGAVGRVHRLEHVGDELAQLGRREALDRTRDREQPRVAHLQDRANRHRGPAPTAPPNVASSRCACHAAITSGGACTSSTRTPAPATGNASFGRGWMKQMSWPLAPVRIPPGAMRTPFASSHATAARRSSIHRPTWLSAGRWTAGLPFASIGSIRSTSTRASP